MFKNYYLKRGIVKDTNDPDKQGRIKIQIIPEMKDMSNDVLPWVKPFNGISDSNNQSFDTFNLETIVWVLVDELWKNFYFMKEYTIPNKISYDDLQSILDSVSDIDSFTYGKIRLQSFEDGSLQFYNIENGDMASIKSNGNYIVQKGDGSIYTKVGDTQIKQEESITTLDIGQSQGTLETNGKVKISASTELTLATGDSALWQPNILSVDPFSGVAHGGSTAGISKLKGGA